MTRDEIRHVVIPFAMGPTICGFHVGMAVMCPTPLGVFLWLVFAGIWGCVTVASYRALVRDADAPRATAR